MRKWHVMETHGNMFQSGFPDLFITHHQYRHRWVEVKNTEGSFRFTPAQLHHFPLMSAHGTPIWVVGPWSEIEYQKLFQPENWHIYLNLSRRY